ncbi:PAS domain-containing protein [Streptomyces sp. NBC_00083]|uniref:PAS domain-containing protein n=1 Tax=Streptomyces sp. NBC_00083 TaxID=2975647 RepID=UPI00224E82F0|nr:PAS domain-containing protein [Streptomyces sp. NBC_00083]MCX5386587.1 PAS domain-containing protein [Streptomyces sp. NBC_00083]
MTQTEDDFGDELADFVRRVGELRTARARPVGEHAHHSVVLDAALFELQHVAEQLWPRYERMAAGSGSTSPEERQERLLLKALFQRMPLPVALIDRETVVRRLNFAATGLTGVRAGYAAGRPLAALLTPGDRAAFRSQAAAVARGEGDRGLTVRLQQRPEEPLLATLTALRPPDEPQPAVLVVFQAGSARSSAAAPPQPELPDLAESTRHAELMDLVDAMASVLLHQAPGETESLLTGAARVLCGRFAEWVVADLVDGGLRRVISLGPDDPAAAPLLEAVAAQDPADCPVVLEAARAGSGVLQVQPEDVGGFGHDPSGTPVLARAEVSSLMCVPLGAPGPVTGVLTLFRTGSARPFSMAEGRAMDVMSRHIALAMRRPGRPEASTDPQRHRIEPDEQPCASATPPSDAAAPPPSASPSA